MNFLTINVDGQLVAKSDSDFTKIIESIDDLTAFENLVGEDGFMCSSSIDFPEEFTSNAEVIALCELIRGA